MKPLKKVKCIFCSKMVTINRKGNITPHIVHPGKQCCGNGAKASQIVNTREHLDKLAKERK